MLIFVERGKPENPKKNPRSKDENQQQTKPTPDRNRTRATMMGWECHHRCPIPAPKRVNLEEREMLREHELRYVFIISCLGMKKIQKGAFSPPSYSFFIIR